MVIWKRVGRRPKPPIRKTLILSVILSDLKVDQYLLNTSADEIQVTWESATDPMNPKNWGMKDKWAVTLLISCFLLATLMSSTIISPALPAIAENLDITSDVEIQTSMSVFVLGYAFGPLFLAPLSEMYGRIIVVQLSNVWFVIWSIVSGLAATKAQMITARLMAGIGGSAALAVKFLTSYDILSMLTSF